MKETFQFEATARTDEGKGASRRLRREGLVPGIVYGGGKDPEMIATPHNTLVQHLEEEAFYSHILSVNIDGKSQNVVLKDLQRHPAKPFVMHFDLMRVSDTDRIKMHVPLHFVGENEAPGAKAGGQFTHIESDLEIICQAKDLPEFIPVDVSGMEGGDVLHLTDLKMPEGVEIVAMTHEEFHDATIVTLHAPRAETEEEEEGGIAAEEAGEEEESSEE